MPTGSTRLKENLILFPLKREGARDRNSPMDRDGSMKSSSHTWAIVPSTSNSLSTPPQSSVTVPGPCGWRIVISPAAGHVTLLHSVLAGYKTADVCGQS